MRYKIIRQGLLLTLFSCCLTINGCKMTPQPQNVQNKQFVEMLGSWSSGTACRLDVAEIDGHLFLREFVAKNTRIKEAELVAKKVGVMIDFSAQEQSVLIQGSLSDGNMIIEKYCPDVLHKTNNL